MPKRAVASYTPDVVLVLARLSWVVLVAAVATGVTGSNTFTVPEDVPAILGTYPPVIVVLAIAAGLTAVAHRQWERGPAAVPNRRRDSMYQRTAARAGPYLLCNHI